MDGSQADLSGFTASSANEDRATRRKIDLKETRYPTDLEEKYIKWYLKRGRQGTIFLYGGIAVLAACTLLLAGSDSGVPFSVYFGLAIAILLSFIMVRRQRRAGQSSYSRRKLVKTEGEVERSGGYFTYFTLASLPVFLPTVWRKEFRKSEGKHVSAEGYFSESGYFYPVEVETLDLSLERDMREDIISI